MPSPRSPAGMWWYRSRSRIPASAAIASAQPTPDPNPNTAASGRVRPRSTISSDAPRIAQLTAMSGRKTPRAAWRIGKKRSSAISTTWTVAAIVPMKVRKRRNDRSWPDSEACAQPRAPGRSR